MLRSTNIISAAVALSLLVACGPGGSDDPTGGSGGSTDQSSGGSGGSPGSGGTPGSGGEDAGSYTEAPDLGVEILNLVFAPSLTLRVRNPANNANVDGCATVSEGACTLRTCPLAESPAQTYRHAGQVTASFDATEQTLIATVSPDETGFYSPTSFEPTGYILGGEEPGVVTAAGGEIGAFQQDLSVPLLLLTTNPTQLVGTRYEVAVERTGDFDVTWDRGTAGVYYLMQLERPIESATHSYQLSCSFESAPGTGQIPGALLSALPSGGVLLTLTVARYDFMVGEDHVRIQLAAETTTPDRDGWVVLRLLD